ncbi:MAG: response regulator, partial [Candidatus Rokubacteria bacterium]|nr:response regulator [Candidatus Rokubacteria bacterium]
RTDDADEVTRNLEIAERGLLDAGEVVRRMSAFSRAQGMAEWLPVDLNELAREVIELTRPRWQAEAQIRGVTIDARLEPGRIPKAAGDAAALREVLMNLIFNAVDALPAGGSIVVRTWSDGEALFCAVADTGTGMAPAVRKRALEPFFTTKGLKATGLGLSVSYGIVRRHGGELTIDSAEGRGTTVTFRLLPTGPVPAPSAPAAAPAAPAAKLRILLIDDDAEVRSVIAEMLAMEKHAVISAAGGLQGLAWLDGDEPVDLVLTDLGMPGMTGWDVARAVKARRPAVQVGIITGWGEEQRARFQAEGVADFIVQKPITRAGLVRAVTGRTPAPGRAR